MEASGDGLRRLMAGSKVAWRTRVSTHYMPGIFIWLGFKVFEQLGDLHTIQCIYQQPGEHDTPVSFSQHEPEFLYDTGWTATTSALETESAAQTPAQQPHRWLMTIAAIASIALLVRFLSGRK